MLPSRAAAMSHAAFSMNHAARKNTTGTGRFFRASSIRPRAFNKLGLGASAPIVESATTFFGFAAARAVYIDTMNFLASGNPGAGSNTGGSIAKTPSVPSKALASAPASAKSATAMSQPRSAHAAALPRSRTTARTGWSAERRLRATAAPTFPVIPVTAYIFRTPLKIALWPDGAQRCGRGWDDRARRGSPGTFSLRCQPGALAPGTTRRRAAAGTHDSLALADG